MTNIHSLFPDKEPQLLSRAIQEMHDWFKEQGVPPLFTDLILKLSNDTMRQLLPNHVLERVGYMFTKNTGNADFRITLYSKVREDLVPEFGTQSHTDFFNIYAFNVKEKPDIVPFPDTLYQGLIDYFSSYPNQPSSHISFCYALVKLVLEDPRFRYVPMEIDKNIEAFKDKYVFALTQDPDEEPYSIYVVTFDFLPIVLDNSALALWSEKFDSQKD